MMSEQKRLLDELNLRYSVIIGNALTLPEAAFVFGEGQASRPPMMLIGEAPGEQETIQRRPFVGKAGKILDSFLLALALDRADIYITNVVKTRPFLTGPGGRLSNRPPNEEETEAFTPWLNDEITLVAPKMIVTLGNTPLKALMGADARIGERHGQMSRTSFGVPLYSLYHPAATIYKRELLPVYEKDVLKLRDLLPAK